MLNFFVPPQHNLWTLGSVGLFQVNDIRQFLRTDRYENYYHLRILLNSTSIKDGILLDQDTTHLYSGIHDRFFYAEAHMDAVAPT